MNAVCRPLWAGVCLLAVLMPGLSASGQAFLPQEVIQAEQITPAMTQQIRAVVDASMDKLIDGDAKAVTEARGKLLGPLENTNASPAFRDAFSEQTTSRMDKAINHDSALVRMNAMIVLSRMTDEKSMALIASGLVDKSEAVQSWAMKALRNRVVTWKNRAGGNAAGLNAKFDAAIKQVKTKLETEVPPHPIVVGPALETLLVIDTTAARAELIEQLSQRIALHKADPNLSYAPEQVVAQRFAGVIALSSPFDQNSANGLSGASFQYAVLIHNQLKAGAIADEKIDSAKDALYQFTTALAQVAAGARTNAPPAQAGLKDAIVKDRWDDIQRLLTNDWAVILRAAPFGLNNEQLGIGE